MRFAAAFALTVLLIVPAARPGQPAGRRAPGFALPDRNMQFHDLADYRGKVVLLDIMVTSCPNCQTLARTLEKLKASYGDKIAVLSVVNPPDNPNTVAAFIENLKITSPILFDCGQMAGSYLRPDPKNPRIHVPHLFVIDQAGLIRYDFGHTEKEIFEGKGLPEIIDRLLGANASKK
jgi:peroxiredoxin